MFTRRRSFPLAAVFFSVVLLASAALLAGCGGGGGETVTQQPAGSHEATPKPTAAAATETETPGEEGVEVYACDLFTDDEAAQLVSGYFSKSELSDHYDCEWDGDGDVLAIVVFEDQDPSSSIRDTVQMLWGAYGEIQEVNDVGDEAFWVSEPRVLHVRFGTTAFIIQGMSPSYDLARLSDVAEKASDGLEAATHGEQETATPNEALNPCHLLTDDEVSALLGDNASGGPLSSSDCMWTGDRGSLQISQVTLDQPSLSASGYPTEGGEEISGLGDEAWWFGYGLLNVRKGTSAIIMLAAVGVMQPEESRQLAEDAASLMLDKMD